MFNTFAYVTDFEYDVEADGTIRIGNSDLEKLVDFPALAQEIYHFVSDVAVRGTEYHIYLDVEKTKFGRVRVNTRTVCPQV